MKPAKKRIKNKKGLPGKRINCKESSDPQYDEHHPLFSLEHLDNKYCISRCDTANKAQFAEALRKISQFTWKDLKSKPRHALGFEKIKKTSMNVAIPHVVTADTIIIAFRFNGKKPMVGFRKKDIFYIIWLDRNFSVYKHS